MCVARPEVRPAPVLFVIAGAPLAALVEQSLTDLMLERDLADVYANATSKGFLRGRRVAKRKD